MSMCSDKLVEEGSQMCHNSQWWSWTLLMRSAADRKYLYSGVRLVLMDCNVSVWGGRGPYLYYIFTNLYLQMAQK